MDEPPSVQEAPRQARPGSRAAGQSVPGYGLSDPSELGRCGWPR